MPSINLFPPRLPLDKEVGVMEMHASSKHFSCPACGDNLAYGWDFQDFVDFLATGKRGDKKINTVACSNCNKEFKRLYLCNKFLLNSLSLRY
jgi:hypothetical protein